jgi:shikimate dehydrogenase
MSTIDLAVNASPVGLNADDPLPFSVDDSPHHAVVADVIMEPRTTRLLAAAHSRGLKVHHGRNMMNFGMPIAASFFGLPESFDWNGAAVQK